MNQNEFVPSHVDIIAEIGINHNGDLNIAKELIDVAKRAGCDAVKFQKRTIGTVYTPEFLESPRESPWGSTQRDQKEGLEFGEKEYDYIDAYCRSLGIDLFASEWDCECQLFLNQEQYIHLVLKEEGGQKSNVHQTPANTFRTSIIRDGFLNTAALKTDASVRLL